MREKMYERVPSCQHTWIFVALPLREQNCLPDTDNILLNPRTDINVDTGERMRKYLSNSDWMEYVIIEDQLWESEPDFFFPCALTRPRNIMYISIYTDIFNSLPTSGPAIEFLATWLQPSLDFFGLIPPECVSIRSQPGNLRSEFGHYWWEILSLT